MESTAILLDGYNIVLSYSDAGSSTFNRKIGAHKGDGCKGDVYLFHEDKATWVACGDWSVTGRCRLLHLVEDGKDVSTFDRLIAYAKSLS